MNLLKLLNATSRMFYLYLAGVSLISSFTNLGILMMFNTALQGKNTTVFGRYDPLAFLLLIVISFVSAVFIRNKIARVTNEMVFDLEISIIQKLRNTSYEAFALLGKEKIYAAISDAQILGQTPEFVVNFIIAFITFFLPLMYLFWVSPAGAAILLVLMVILFWVYILLNKKIMHDLNTVRDYQNSYYALLQELLSGFKQIRISDQRNEALFNDHILPNRSDKRELTIKSSAKYSLHQLFGIYCWYFVLGIIVFILPLIIPFNVHQVASFITTTLFIMSPLTVLISVIPFYSHMKIALERINEIDTRLTTETEPQQPGKALRRDFTSIRFEDISYEYTLNGIASFTIDLAGLSIYANEVLFVAGSNGSGKTTFIHLLTGLIKPLRGQIYIDGSAVTWEEYCAFRSSMAVVYNDHHLFQQNYDKHDLTERNEKLHYFKRLLNMEDVLKWNSAASYYDTRLSKGQQKRMALLLALLEDKPIIVLDEWAAEQDPFNRGLFYSKWLSVMKQQGKTIVVITHDDDSFHHADRLVKFSYGKIASDTGCTINLKQTTGT